MLTTKNSSSRRPRLGWAVLGLVLLSGCQPPGPQALLEGERLLQAGKYTEAVEQLQVATRLLPQNAQAWNHLGLAYHGSGRWAEAIRTYQWALARDRNLAAARYNLGCLYLEQNNLTRAISELTSFTMLQPNVAAGWVKLGTAQLRAGKSDDSEKSFLAAIKLDPQLPEALNDLGIIQVQRKRPGEALKYFNEALRRQPDYAPAVLNMASVLHHSLNNRSLALQRYKDYLALNPPVAQAAAVQQVVRTLDLELPSASRLTSTSQVTQPLSVPPKAPPPATARTQLVVASAAPVGPPAQTNQSPLPATAPVIKTDSKQAAKPESSPAIAQAMAPPAKRALAEKAPTPSSEPPAPSRVETKPEPPPKVEVVRLAEEPAPKAAQDIVINVAPPAPAPATEPVPTVTPTPLPEPTKEVAEAASVADVRSRRKPTLLHRINPLSWFRSGNKSTPASTPAAKVETELAKAAPAETKAATSENAPLTNDAVARAPALVPDQPARPRYPYQPHSRPAQGHRLEAEKVLAKGVLAHQERRLLDAIKAYREATRLDPSYFEAHYNMGLAAYEAKNLPQALASLEEAVSLDPASANARYQFGVALQQANYSEDAAHELQQLLADHPDETRAHFALANLCAQQLNRKDLARQHYRRVLELDPRHAQALQIRYWLAAHPPP
ncbi:MAG: tetratricopeptide repeat protein [Chloroflexi bacterium]|nr:tetratricopeptide repeat protein [Chloroflexota bacterium]